MPGLTGNLLLIIFVTVLNCACDMSDEIVLIQNLIYEIRGQRVMLDSDLAKLYGIETRELKQCHDGLFKITNCDLGQKRQRLQCKI